MKRTRARDLYLRRTYGLTLAQYLKMMLRQARRCAICRRHFEKYRAYVDHDHKTGRVRGLLCYLCNHRLLGRGLEVPEHHARAAEYLRSDFDGRSL